MKKYALLSVSDRTGLAQLADALHAGGYTLLATSSTAKALEESKVPWVSVEDYTGLAELLDGRVKTLHPKIHGGILARRDQTHHTQQMKEADIGPIDVVVVNLYPFTSYLGTERAKDPEQMTELVDVGGPTMIRAAAKNHKFVLPLIDPSDYGEVISLLKQSVPGKDPFTLEFRRKLAAKVFGSLSQYDGAIAQYFSGLAHSEDDGAKMPEQCAITLNKVSTLRYGENPHQAASLYTASSATLPLFSGPVWKLLGGKELSYNNMLDLDAGLRILADFPQDRTAVAILKHLNPCGVATGASLTEAIERAKECDPRSHFGGVLVCNREVDRNAAEEIRGDFAELIIAPSFSADALETLKMSKNLRILQVDVSSMKGFDLRTVAGGVLVQQPDINRSRIAHATLSSSRTPTNEELADLELAWRIVGHVKSNAIVLVRDGLLIGVGAGQMSRIDSVELAIRKAKTHGHLLNGAVAASDAFFPFPDSVETLAAEGVTCVIAPAGARRDDDVKATANEKGLSLFFASDRHFRH